MSRTSAAVLAPSDLHAEYAKAENSRSVEVISGEGEKGFLSAVGETGAVVQEMAGSGSVADSKFGSDDQSKVRRFGARSASPNSAPRSSASLSEMSDQELLEGIRAESELHFAELYSRYFQRIYNFVYGRMRNHAETEEVVQETFIAVFRSFGNYRGQSSLLSWIYGIAKNTANNNLRRAKSQHERIEMADDEDLIPHQSIDLAMPDEQLDLRRFREQLSERLESVASWQAEIFEMRHFENLSIPEISKRTSRSSDAVRSSLYRVKRLFFDAVSASGGTTVVVGGSEL
jgi:RNA polymerase sigma-70 factor (ECF subfamily)